MTTQIKYLEFKGIDKKEQILFKSFLNLAKNELSYQVVILKADYPSSDAPDMIITDEQYEFAEDEQQLSTLPTITVGDDVDNIEACYIARPVQWSDFKLALSQLEIEPVEGGGEQERVLPEDIRFAIEEHSQELETQRRESGLSTSDNNSESSLSETAESEDEYDYDFELDNMSADYFSYTNSDYVKAADDVRGFKGDEEGEVSEAVILMTDEESASDNSVLVIETDSFDAWDLSDSQISTSTVSSYEDFTIEADSEEAPTPKRPSRHGFEVDPDEEYWLEDNEIIVDQQTLLCIKTKREMVYSTKPPGDWPSILQRRGLSKLPLKPDWRPESMFTAYPLSSLVWVNTLIRETSELHDDLDEGGEYILDHWPPFDLLELDNILLKLCTMMFVRAESAQSLAAKSGYGRSTIIGLMNACYEMGLLTTADKIDVSTMTKTSNDEGMLGRIKDVFR